jgi:hypothetical protein
VHHNSFNNVDGAETKFGLILLAWIVSDSASFWLHGLYLALKN